MSINGAPQQGAGAEERPAWFTAYLEILTIKREEVQAKALENVFSGCEDVSEVFKNNISAAYRSESHLEAARQASHEALNQTLLRTLMLYTAPYVQIHWTAISPEQAKVCLNLNNSLVPLDFSSRSLKSWLQHFEVIFSKKFISERVARLPTLPIIRSKPSNNYMLVSTKLVRTASQSTSRKLETLLQMLMGMIQPGLSTRLPSSSKKSSVASRVEN